VYQSEHDFWAIKRAILTKIATCGLAEEKENKKRQTKKVTKPLYFTTTWRRHFATDLHQIWWVCRLYRCNHACQVLLQNIYWFFQAERWKIAKGLYNSAMRYRAGLWYSCWRLPLWAYKWHNYHTLKITIIILTPLWNPWNLSFHIANKKILWITIRMLWPLFQNPSWKSVKCVQRPLADNWQWRHIRLAIKPRDLGNHASQIKRYYGSLS